MYTFIDESPMVEAIMGKFDWMSNPQYLAQVGHFLGGAILIVIAALFSIVLGAGWNPILITLGIGVGAATYKEFVFDTSLLKNLPVVGKWAFFQGEGDTWPNSLMDWSFYMLGGGVGMGIAALAEHLAKHCVC